MNGVLRHAVASIAPAVLAIPVAISTPGAPLSALVLSFMAYGFVGWLWESTVCAMLNHGSFSNSGFCLGLAVLFTVWVRLFAGLRCAASKTCRCSFWRRARCVVALSTLWA